MRRTSLPTWLLTSRPSLAASPCKRIPPGGPHANICQSQAAQCNSTAELERAWRAAAAAAAASRVAGGCRGRLACSVPHSQTRVLQLRGCGWRYATTR
eukprot:362607-Chlamydomonas_euryale.AAC.23